MNITLQLSFKRASIIDNQRAVAIAKKNFTVLYYFDLEGKKGDIKLS